MRTTVRKQKSDAGTRTIRRPCKQPQSFRRFAKSICEQAGGLLSEKMRLSLAPSALPLDVRFGSVASIIRCRWSRHVRFTSDSVCTLAPQRNDASCQ
jgi:hypothetical protein